VKDKYGEPIKRWELFAKIKKLEEENLNLKNRNRELEMGIGLSNLKRQQILHLEQESRLARAYRNRQVLGLVPILVAFKKIPRR
jgi:hypothetical protein